MNKTTNEVEVRALAGQNEKSKMYQGSARWPERLKCQMYRRYLAGRPTFCNGHKKRSTTHGLTNTYHTQTIVRAWNIDPFHQFLTKSAGSSWLLSLRKNPSIIPYLLFIFCTIGTVRNIVLCMDSGMGLGVTHLSISTWVVVKLEPCSVSGI